MTPSPEPDDDLTTLHREGNPPPDPEVPCCWMAIQTHGQDCTCWAPIRSANRAVPKEGPCEVRGQMCGDCAYRKDSPERADQGGDSPSYGRSDPFFCHQGVAHVVMLIHPTGATLQGQAGDYDPIRVADRIFQSDGTPGVLCAGWAASNLLPRGLR